MILKIEKIFDETAKIVKNSLNTILYLSIISINYYIAFLINGSFIFSYTLMYSSNFRKR